jgi:quercetin dioxygenase-like cupin family protein
MLTRRFFVECVLCAAAGFVAVDASAGAQTPGLSRTVLSQIDGPTDGLITMMAKVEIEPGATIARHTHPGVESGYVIDGGLTLEVLGQPAKSLKAGDAFQIPTGVPHGGTCDTKTTLVAVYVVEKGKPLASPA